MDLSNRTAITNSVMKAILDQIAEKFPVVVYVNFSEIATMLGLAYSEKVDEFGRNEVIDAVIFDGSFREYTYACLKWLDDASYIQIASSNGSRAATLTERGAVMMGCLPAILSRAPVVYQPGDENL